MPCQSPGLMKNSSYYIAPVGFRTHDLPHTVASNMGKVSYALTHSATAAVESSSNLWRSTGTLCYCASNVHIHSQRDALQEALITLHEEANLVGMQISRPKTKLMAIDSYPTNHLPLNNCELYVDSFTYLGSLITNDGSSSHYITSRIAKAASAMYRVYQIHSFANTATA